jgi:iron complex transport system substrate-binding protein
MRGFAFVSVISGLAAAAPAHAVPPRRAASLNLCTDELLLLLGRKDRIASVSHLGRNPAETPLWRRGLAYPRNDGSLLSVVDLRPDLVLTMGGGARDRVGIARRLGIRLIDLPYPLGLADVEEETRTVAAALGRPQAAAPIVAAIERLRRGAPARGIDALWLGGGGRTVAAGSLAGQWMALAGLRQRRTAGDRVTLEQLLVRPPAVILRSDYRAGQYSSDQKWLMNPIAARARGSRVVTTDGRLWNCMGPLMVAEVERLRAAMAGGKR